MSIIANTPLLIYLLSFLRHFLTSRISGIYAHIVTNLLDFCPFCYTKEIPPGT